ncbi:SICA antigen [Plasmodium coatneyi]|uniref:SICA antigen n=1 Tax=Plasmodium coatneyi TaxID=208452 RepID=A0A1B1DTL3_9APIC|nr:SICA antigen [Plasmodium coatneyi]ANQ05947.1 SICA antigen [Plasmodium coatneyi]
MPKKQGVGRRDDRPIGRRTIIDIHLEVLDECQKEDLHSTKEEFLEILVQEIMGNEFMKKEKVPSSVSGFREEDFVPKEYVPTECAPMVNVPKEEVPSSDCGFREEDIVPKEEVPSSRLWV